MTAAGQMVDPIGAVIAALQAGEAPILGSFVSLAALTAAHAPASSPVGASAYATGIGPAYNTGFIWAPVSTALTPQMFGACGDGVHDDGAALQAWIVQCEFNSGSTGGVAEAYLPAGTYKIRSTLYFTANTIRFRGAGKQLSVITTAGGIANGFDIFAFNPASVPQYWRADISDIGILTDQYSGYGFNLSGTTITYDSSFRNLFTTTGMAALYAGTNGTFFSNRIDNWIARSYYDHAFKVSCGPGVSWHNCYASWSGSYKAGYRLAGAIALYSCNGVDSNPDGVHGLDTYWGIFGSDTTAPSSSASAYTANAISTLGTLTNTTATTGTYYNVPLTGGSGEFATATIVAVAGVITSVTIKCPGTGYAVADTLSAGVAGSSLFTCKVASLDAFQNDLPSNSPQVIAVQPNIEGWTKIGLMLHLAYYNFEIIGGALFTPNAAYAAAIYSRQDTVNYTTVRNPVKLGFESVLLGSGSASLANIFGELYTAFQDTQGALAKAGVVNCSLPNIYGGTLVPLISVPTGVIADVYNDVAIQNNALSPRRLSVQMIRYATTALTPVGAAQAIVVTGFTKAVVTPASAASISTATFVATVGAGLDQGRNGGLIIEAGNGNLTINFSSATYGFRSAANATTGNTGALSTGQIVQFLWSETNNCWVQV
jgi:hypothetical protein